MAIPCGGVVWRRVFGTIALASVAACSGGDGATSSTTTTAAALVAAEPLFPSLSGFVAAFTAVGSSGATQGAEFALDDDTMTTGAIDSELGTSGFISLDAIPSGAIGGSTDDDGAVTSVFVFVDPLTTGAAPAVLSLLATTIASEAQFDQAAFAEQYRALAADAAIRVGDQVWVPSTNDSGHSIVVTVVEGASGGNDLVEVAIVPVADEGAAKAAAKPLRNAVFGLVG
jgi:hypothetical protein